MWFKNLLVYRLPDGWNIAAEELERMLSELPLQPCGGFEMESRGWVCPREEGSYLYPQEMHWLIALGEEQKLLPASVIKQEAEKRAQLVAERQGRPVGRKQLRDIKSQVTDELLPRALARQRRTRAWIDAKGQWLGIEAAADAKAETFMEHLRRVDDRLSATRLDTQRSPAGCMADWVSRGEAPGPFELDADLELRAPTGSKPAVRYSRHSLDGKDIREHIASGKTVVQLGLTWNDKISFVLTEQLQIKRISFLEILRRESDGELEDEEVQFGIDFALMTGELSRMLADLVRELGGEKAGRREESEAA